MFSALAAGNFVRVLRSLSENSGLGRIMQRAEKIKTKAKKLMQTILFFIFRPLLKSEIKERVKGTVHEICGYKNEEREKEQGLCNIQSNLSRARL